MRIEQCSAVIKWLLFCQSLLPAREPISQLLGQNMGGQGMGDCLVAEGTDIVGLHQYPQPIFPIPSPFLTSDICLQSS